jgi:hypothetical protein
MSHGLSRQQVILTPTSQGEHMVELKLETYATETLSGASVGHANISQRKICNARLQYFYST